MSSRARSRRGGRRGAHGGEGHEDGERWLLTYADMITLLMALFMVLFSISSVNISKIQALQKSLRAAFSPDNILPGGKAIAKQGSTASAKHAVLTREVQPIVPVTPHASNLESNAAAASASASVPKAEQEQSSFEHLKHQLDAYAAHHGFSQDVNTTVQPRGLVIRVLTDRLLFGSGSATLIAQARPLLSEIAGLVNVDHTHPIAVEGNTDNVPIHSASFPSNWELSTGRASMVVRFLIDRGVYASRLSASGYAALRPIDSNSTPQGRARNRRVEIVLQRIYGSSAQPVSEASNSTSGAGTGASGTTGAEGP